jgi:hypothetical protein
VRLGLFLVDITDEGPGHGPRPPACPRARRGCDTKSRKTIGRSKVGPKIPEYDPRRTHPDDIEVMSVSIDNAWRWRASTMSMTLLVFLRGHYIINLRDPTRFCPSQSPFQSIKYKVESRKYKV